MRHCLKQGLTNEAVFCNPMFTVAGEHVHSHMRMCTCAHTQVHTCTHCVQCTNCLIFMHLCCLSCYTLSVHSKAVHRDVSKYLMFYNCSDLQHVLGHNHTEEDSMNSWENVHSAVRILLSVYYPTICLSCFSLSPSPSCFITFFYLKKELWFLEIIFNFYVRANNLHGLLGFPWIF